MKDGVMPCSNPWEKGAWRGWKLNSRERLNGIVFGGACKQAKRSDCRRVLEGDR